jgi:hypothetical protein
MANVNIASEKTYSIQINGLTEYQVLFLMNAFQNSPVGHHPNDEPQEEAELRKTIFDKCKQVLM